MQIFNGRGQYKKGHHFRHLSVKQIEFVYFNDKKIVDDIFFYENLDHYFLNFCLNNNLDFNKLLYLNKSIKGLNFMSYFDGDSIAKFNELFIDDLVLLGYSANTLSSSYDAYSKSNSATQIFASPLPQ